MQWLENANTATSTAQSPQGLNLSAGQSSQEKGGRTTGPESWPLEEDYSNISLLPCQIFSQLVN